MPPGTYNWPYTNHDDDGAITAAAGGVTYSRVIQNPDGHGGYNVSFSVTNQPLACYHVHFKAGGTRVMVVRYKATSIAQGNNILQFRNDGDPWTLGSLAYGCGERWPNHKTLLDNLKAAIAGVARAANNELT